MNKNKNAILVMVIASLFSINAYAERNDKDSFNGNLYKQRDYLIQDSTSGTNLNNVATTATTNQTYSCGIQPVTTTQACGGNYNSGYVNTTTYTTCNPSTGVQQQYQTSSNTCACNVPANTTFSSSCQSGYTGSITYARNYYCSGGSTSYNDTVISNTCTRRRSGCSLGGGGDKYNFMSKCEYDATNAANAGPAPTGRNK